RHGRAACIAEHRLHPGDEACTEVGSASANKFGATEEDRCRTGRTTRAQDEMAAKVDGGGVRCTADSFTSAEREAVADRKPPPCDSLEAAGGHNRAAARAACLDHLRAGEDGGAAGVAEHIFEAAGDQRAAVEAAGRDDLDATA